MTLQEQKEYEDGAQEYALRAILADNIERFGKQRVLEILELELKALEAK